MEQYGSLLVMPVKISTFYLEVQIFQTHIYNSRTADEQMVYAE